MILADGLVERICRRRDALGMGNQQQGILEEVGIVGDRLAELGEQVALNVAAGSGHPVHLDRMAVQQDLPDDVGIPLSTALVNTDVHGMSVAAGPRRLP